MESTVTCHLNDSAPDVGWLSRASEDKIPKGCCWLPPGARLQACLARTEISEFMVLDAASPRVASWPRKPRDFVTIEELAAPGSDQRPLEEVLDGRRMQPHREAAAGREVLGQAWEQRLCSLPCPRGPGKGKRFLFSAFPVSDSGASSSIFSL